MYLSRLYKNTCIEIVGETTFFVEPGMLTEKYLHTVFGCNFPIVLNVPGTVDYLRRQGFDLFDDIVDHSYDLEKIHANRIMRAIDDNYLLLSNKKHATDLWLQCRERFQHNLDHATMLSLNAQQRFDKLLQINLRWPNEI
jgi:hypothetical protein